MILAQGVVEERRVWIAYDSFENSGLERVIQPRELFGRRIGGIVQRSVS